MNEQHSQLLARVVSAIGQPRFAEVASRSLSRITNFDLSTIVVHRPRSRPEPLFDDLSAAGYGAGMENYLQFTHRTNPMLASEGIEGAFRARDFRLDETLLPSHPDDCLVPAPDEELGFRTIGWPQRTEEIGLCFRGCGGLVELSLYRERARKAAPPRTLRTLDGLRATLAAAFERHDHFGQPAASRAFAALTKREREIADLLLVGCSSEAVALRLGITRHTVKDHRKEIFRKLRIGSLAQFFALAHAASTPDRSGHQTPRLATR
jgi:DNA-binding CsgD family transcriptional regulator